MESKILKQKGGSCCAIATCINNYSKSKNDGKSNISFHRFPKDLNYRKEWVQKCKRGDHFNPDTSFICSDHFNVDAFVRDLKAELLGYKSKSRRLKEDAIPTLNLPTDLVESASIISRRSRMERKSIKEIKMPSEVVQKETEIAVNEKDIIGEIDTKIETKGDGSQESKTEEIQAGDKLEKSKITEEESSESENKENEEPTVEDIELQKKRADQLLTDGKRHLIIKDFQVAVDVLSEACSLFGTIYSELDEKCAEAYFNYGCALLELSKNQTSPVGLEEKDEEENDGETSSEEMDSSNVTNEDNKASISNVTVEVEEKETDNVDDKSAEKKNEELIKKEEESTENKKILPEETSAIEEENEDKVQSTEKEEMSVDEVEEQFTEKEEVSVDEAEKPDEDVEEDDVNDLQIAWEMLDLAKVIYKNKDTEESKLKLAEVLMKCGEVSIEDEKFETAIQDMTESLEIRRLLLPEDSRIIAETLFQLGIAQELGGSGEQAIELLTEAAAVLNQKIKTLESMDNDSETTQAEIAEVKSIIPEIQEKIVDIKERKKAAVSALLAAVGACNVATTNGEASSTIKQASNIGHLVRKRPKQEETADAAPNKVPKLDDSSNSKQ